MFGDDFNFVVVTNNQIQLFMVKINKAKSKLVKTIQYGLAEA